MKYRHIEVIDEQTIRQTGNILDAYEEAAIFTLLAKSKVHFWVNQDKFPTVLRKFDFVKCVGDVNQEQHMQWLRNRFNEPQETAAACQSPHATDSSNTLVESAAS